MRNNVNRNPKFLREKKSWIREVTAIVQSKYRKLKRSRTLRRTVSGVNNTMSSILTRRTRNSRSRSRHLQKLRRARTFLPVYAEDLYSIDQKGGLTSQVVQKENNKSLHAEKARSCSSSSELTNMSTATTSCRLGSADYSGRPPASSLLLVDDEKAATADVELEGVDLKAEMFIARFRQEMRLQRQKSFEEYQEMLARGV